MNIRVQPAVRCSYVAEENVLRVVLKEVAGETGNVGSSSSAAAESSGSEDKAMHREVVVYALKVLSLHLPWFDWELMVELV